MKFLLRLFKLGCLFFLIFAGAAFYFLYTAIMPADPEATRQPVIVEVPEGATAGEIAAMLEQQKLIPSAFAFKLLIRYGGNGASIRTGHYKISPSQAPLKILEQLVKGETLRRKVTFPEGLTLNQVAEIVGKSGVCPKDEFLKVARTGGQEFGEPFPANLEGYLFPDTYEFPWEASAKEVVKQMTDRFREVSLPLWSAKAPLSLRESVILASLVEGEAQVASERPVIAGVYLNRLAEGMLLQCDATVQYALGKPKAILLHRDLEIPSPYNTYLYPGLPPGPICNPGKAAFEAAVKPKRSEYLFYVRNDVKGDGSHVFTRDYSEHQRAIERYQR